MRSPVIVPSPTDTTQSPWKALIHREWVRFLNELRGLLGTVLQVIGSVNLTDQSAAITATAIPTPTLEEGIYRVAFSLRITRAATTSSAVGVTLGWTFNSTSCSQVFALVTGNTLASQSSDMINMAVDAGTSITYTTSYASSGATTCAYALDIYVESVP